MGSDVQPGTLREFAGEPLDKILARGGPLPVASVPDVIDRVGTALAAAQSAGSVPADLQAAMAAARGASVPDPVDPLDAAAAQLWLAALAYNLLAGHPVPPLDAGQTVPKPIRAYRPEVPAETEAVVFRGLNGDGQQRYSSLAEFASALRRSAATRLEQDEEERTTVSAVPSGIAAQLRRGHVELPNDERTIVSPSAASDELTVVSPSGRHEPPRALGLPKDRGVPLATSSGTMFTPTQQMPRVRDRPRTPPPWLWPAVGVAALAIAVVTWRAIAGAPPSPPPLPAVRASAPAPSAPVRPAAAVPHPPPSTVPPPPAPELPPPSPPVLEPPTTLPAAPEPPASAARGRPTHNHVRARTAAAPEAAPTPAADGAKTCRLSVASYPWAELWVDGADTGLQTPVVGFTISCGRHRLEFKRRDLKVDQIESVTLSDGIEFKRQYELKGAELDD